MPEGRLDLLGRRAALGFDLSDVASARSPTNVPGPPARAGCFRQSCLDASGGRGNHGGAAKHDVDLPGCVGAHCRAGARAKNDLGRMVRIVVVPGVWHAKLSASNILVYLAQHATVAETVDAFKAGSLKLVEPGMACAHHGHQH